MSTTFNKIKNKYATFGQNHIMGKTPMWLIKKTIAVFDISFSGKKYTHGFLKFEKMIGIHLQSL